MNEHKVFWIITVSLTIGGMIVLALKRPEVLHEFGHVLYPRHHHHHRERSANASLKTVATAQADFRANDRDGNGVQDYWHGDIAGLYAIRGIDDQPIKLIDISVAGADNAPITDIHLLTPPEPKAGYHFKALRPPDEADWWEPGHFGACAYPDKYGSPNFRYTYIISHDNTVYKKDLGRPGGIQVFPANLDTHWSKLD